MRFKERFIRSKDDDTTGPLLLVSHKDSLYGMFEELFRDGKGDADSDRIVMPLRCEDLTNTSEVMRDHLGINGMFSKVKKVTATVEKEGTSVSIGVKRGKNRVVFAYNSDTGGCMSSIQRKVGRSEDGDTWEHLGGLERRYDDLYSIVVAIEKHDLINGGGSF